MNRVVKNAGWIIGCKVVKAVLTLIVTMITARCLGVANFGLINYAAGIVAFVAPIMKLGLDAVAVHEIVNHPDKEGETLGTIVILSLLSGVLCIVGILGFTSIANSQEPLTIAVCVVYGLVLIFQAMEMIQYWFQAKLLSQYSAVAMLISYMTVSIVQINLLIKEVDIRLFALSYCVDYLIIVLLLLLFYKRHGVQKLSFSLARSKEMLSISKFYIISGLMITVFNNTDRIMLKLMIDDTATGLYAAAHTCAGMTSFVFVAIIDSMRGVIFESKKNNGENYKKNIVSLYSVIIYFSLIQCVLVTILSPWIIGIIYGEDFLGSIAVLRIAIWFSTFSYLGTVRDVWILSEGYQDYLWKINLSGAVMNVCLNFIFIPIWGPNGAAVASVISQFFTNVITGFIIKKMRPNNLLMLMGLNPRSLERVFNVVLKRK